MRSDPPDPGLRAPSPPPAARSTVAPRTPAITVLVPGVLRDCCAGAASLALSAPSVRSVLEQLESLHPALYRSVCDETGRVRRHVNLFVNTANVRDGDGLDTTLAPGDVVTILPAVSGG
jgi:molybdopterin converting factor small subunit